MRMLPRSPESFLYVNHTSLKLIFLFFKQKGKEALSIFGTVITQVGVKDTLNKFLTLHFLLFSVLS